MPIAFSDLGVDFDLTWIIEPGYLASENLIGWQDDIEIVGLLSATSGISLSNSSPEVRHQKRSRILL